MKRGDHAAALSLVIAALATAGAGCASSRSEVADPVDGIVDVALSLHGEGVGFTSVITQVDLLVDEVPVYAAGLPGEQAPVGSTPISAGEHALLIRAAVIAPDGVRWRWSMTERFIIGPEPATLDVVLTLATGTELNARRIEARFRPERVHLVSGTLPVLERELPPPPLVPAQVEPPLDAADKRLATMRVRLGEVKASLDGARRERDIVKTQCFNDKLGQIEIAIRSADERSRELRAALVALDTDRANHESTILGVLAARVEVLVAEARQCIGEQIELVDDASAPQ